MEVDDDMLDILSMVTMLKEARDCLNEMAGRRYWVKPEYQDRDTKGFFAVHFNRIYKRNTAHFKQITGMSQETFDILFRFLEEALTKNSNRPSITPKCRLFLTLTYLSQGGNRQMLSEKFKMGLTTVKRIITDTCDIIWKTLHSVYVCPPMGYESLRMADEFWEAWNLPHCVGVVDAKLLSITARPNHTAISKKLKSKQSLVLLAVCDANHVFTNIDIGVYNKDTDATTWNLEFFKELISGKLNLPNKELLPNSDINFPYYMIGHSSFPLKTYLMRPYAGNQLTPDSVIFNQHLAKAQSVAENAFGVLTAHWKILQSPLHMSPKTAELIVKATVLLHNFLRNHDETYCPPGYVDAFEGEDIIEGVWRQQVKKPLQSIGRIGSNNAKQKAFDTRDNLKYYLNAIEQIIDNNSNVIIKDEIN
ncbi:protein ALP1-like isoform X3 [Lucilia cuprina]|uniref:protein ALP1-like isoform X3 n=2 Tax=Lucilia cuprina TaxID=7375 RepID=UPI001F05A109|nr:protein ALP1-like isoform X3 [Lucilia cuprina]